MSITQSKEVRKMAMTKNGVLALSVVFSRCENEQGIHTVQSYKSSLNVAAIITAGLWSNSVVCLK